MTYAAKTSISVEKTRAALEDLVRKHSAKEFASGWDEEKAVVHFLIYKRQIRFVLPLPKRTDPKFMYDGRGARRAESAIQQAWDQELRARWRVLLLVIKAKLEAVDSKIVTFEEEFLAFIVLPNGRTVNEIVVPQIAAAYENRPIDENMPPLMLGPASKGGSDG